MTGKRPDSSAELGDKRGKDVPRTFSSTQLTSHPIYSLPARDVRVRQYRRNHRTNNAKTIADLAPGMIEFAYQKCNRQGLHTTEAQARLYGSTTTLPDLPTKVASNCPKSVRSEMTDAASKC